MIFNVLKVLEKERIKYVGARKALLVAILLKNCLRCLMDIGKATNISQKTITGLGRPG